MAEHNEARIVGYLTADPIIKDKTKINENGEEQLEYSRCYLHVETVRRSIQACTMSRYSNILVFYDVSGYDNNEWKMKLLKKIRGLKKGDVVSIKGVVVVQNTTSERRCKECGEIITVPGTMTFVYPIDLIKLTSYSQLLDQRAGENALNYNDEERAKAVMRSNAIYGLAEANRHLIESYYEFSNTVTLLGYVVSQPKLVTEGSGSDHCQYQVAVGRKYYIATDAEQKTDFPWVYTYGEQCQRDMERIVPPKDGKQGTEVLLSAAMIQTYPVRKFVCPECQTVNELPIVKTEFAPYSVEYLENYIKDEQTGSDEENIAKSVLSFF